jgi:hypothetical protein
MRAIIGLCILFGLRALALEASASQPRHAPSRQHMAAARAVLEEAQALVPKIESGHRDEALGHIAETIAITDPNRALRIALRHPFV